MGCVYTKVIMRNSRVKRLCAKIHKPIRKTTLIFSQTFTSIDLNIQFQAYSTTVHTEHTVQLIISPVISIILKDWTAQDKNLSRPPSLQSPTMSSLLPVQVYGLKVPAGDVMIPAITDFPATVRLRSSYPNIDDGN